MPTIKCKWTGCNVLVANKLALLGHVVASHVSRPYSHSGIGFLCSWEACGTTKNKRDHLVSHLKSHVDARNEVCDHCGAGFNHTQDLRKHKRARHGAAIAVPAVNMVLRPAPAANTVLGSAPAANVFQRPAPAVNAILRPVANMVLGPVPAINAILRPAANMILGLDPAANRVQGAPVSRSVSHASYGYNVLGFGLTPGAFHAAIFGHNIHGFVPGPGVFPAAVYVYNLQGFTPAPNAGSAAPTNNVQGLAPVSGSKPTDRSVKAEVAPAVREKTRSKPVVKSEVTGSGMKTGVASTVRKETPKPVVKSEVAPSGVKTEVASVAKKEPRSKLIVKFEVFPGTGDFVNSIPEFEVEVSAPGVETEAASAGTEKTHSKPTVGFEVIHGADENPTNSITHFKAGATAETPATKIKEKRK